MSNSDLFGGPILARNWGALVIRARSYALAVVEQYKHTAFWLQRITDQMPGAAPARGYDTTLGQQLTAAGGVYAQGRQMTDPRTGALREGYLSPRTVQVGIRENVHLEQETADGYQVYDGPMVVYVPPLLLAKGDALILDDGRRMVVGDSVDQDQVFGVDIMRSAKLEERAYNDPIYQLPTT